MALDSFSGECGAKMATSGQVEGSFLEGRASWTEAPDVGRSGDVYWS